jgi:hypothetical protein
VTDVLHPNTVIRRKSFCNLIKGKTLPPAGIDLPKSNLGDRLKPEQLRRCLRSFEGTGEIAGIDGVNLIILLMPNLKNIFIPPAFI